MPRKLHLRLYSTNEGNGRLLVQCWLDKVGMNIL